MNKEIGYAPRDLESEINKYLSRKEILAVIGARQCGKTTLLKHITSKLRNVNSITFEDIKTLELFKTDIDSFIEKYVKGYDYLFIDEVQYAKDSGKKLKYIFDTQKIKILITGSSSAELSLQNLKYLVGRIFIFELFPFSFGEFLCVKDERLFNIFQKAKYGDEIKKQLNKFLEEYILYGGYPEVVLAKANNEKITILKNIYNTFLLKEIREILQLSENDRLVKLMEALALQIGNLINYEELINITGFNFQQLNKYLRILEETFICRRTRPFFTNKRTEIAKAQKIYFYDSGFRNICINNFNKERSDKGPLYENFIFSELTKKHNSLKYWRTQGGAEIDFILNDTIPLEVKSVLKQKKLQKSYYSFIEKYSPKNGFVLSVDFEDKIKIKSCAINFLPFVKFSAKKKY